MNANVLITKGFSNPLAEKAYRLRWPNDPSVAKAVAAGHQCGGCSFFAPFNEDWGLCCYGRSKHFSETVFEHFGCAQIQEEGWDAHSFTETRDRLPFLPK